MNKDLLNDWKKNNAKKFACLMHEVRTDQDFVDVMSVCSRWAQSKSVNSSIDA